MRLSQAIGAAMLATLFAVILGCPGRDTPVQPMPPEPALPGSPEVASDDAQDMPMPDDGVDIQQVEGTIEAEGMRVVSTTGGEVAVEGMTDFGEDFSGGKRITWSGVDPGDALVLGFTVDAAGDYEVAVCPSKGPRHGRFSFSLDGGEASEVVDLGAESVQPGDPVVIGEAFLEADEHTLTITAHEGAEPSMTDFTFGLDYLIIKPTD